MLFSAILFSFCAFGHAEPYPWLEQVQRQEIVNSWCAKKPPKLEHRVQLADLDHLLVDHSHKLLYCYVPKVACTNWKRVFMVLTGLSSNLVDIPGSVAHAENSTLRLSELKPSEALDCLNTYTAFLMVRHPFERLLSAYLNKFVNTYSQYFKLRYGRDIIRKYRANATDAELESGENVTFREFVAFILDDGLLANEHWTPIYNLCRPCYLNYSFIGRYETLVEDARTLLDMVGAPRVHFPYTKSANTWNRLRTYFLQLSIGEIEALYRKYEYDFRLFGYSLEDLLGFDLA